MHPVYYLYPYFPRFFEICQSERKYNSEADLISVLYQISAQKNAFKILILEIIRYVRCLLLDRIFEHIDGPLSGFDPADSCKIFRAFVAHQHSSHGLDIYLILAGFHNPDHLTAAFSGDRQAEISLIAFHDRIDQLKLPFTVKNARFKRVLLNERNKIHDSSHIVW